MILNFKSIRFYFSLWISFAQNSFIRQLEFKVNLVGRLLTELAWISSQLLFFKAVFLQTPHFAGWNEGEIFFFVGSLYLLDGTMMMLLFENQQKLGDVVRNGLLDFYLLRPVSAFFMAAFRFVNVTGVFNLLAGFGILLYPVLTGQVSLTLMGALLWVVYMLNGFVLLTCLLMTANSLAFWTTHTANLSWLFFELYRLGWRPESIYPLWIKRMLLGVFPAAFLVSIPVQISLGQLGGLWLVYPFLWSLVAVLSLKWVWTRGLARYEGALS